jgi:uncharacterized protein (DUF2237 family)
MALAIRFFETAAGRSQPREFLEGLQPRDRACIMADVLRVAEMGRAAPVSVKAITGRPGLLMWILHACRKQDQWHGIEMAVERMKKLRR